MSEAKSSLSLNKAAGHLDNVAKLPPAATPSPTPAAATPAQQLQQTPGWTPPPGTTQGSYRDSLPPGQVAGYDDEVMRTLANQNVGQVMATLGLPVLGGLGLYSAYRAAKPKRVSPQFNMKMAADGVAGQLGRLTGSVLNAGGNVVGGAAHGLGLTPGTSPGDYSQWVAPVMLGGPLSLLAAAKLKKKLDQHYSVPTGEPSELDQAKNEYAQALNGTLGKTAAAQAFEGLVASLEKRAFNLPALYAGLGVPSLMLGGGLLGYSAFNKYDPDRIKADAAAKAYRAKRIATRPTVQVVSPEPGEDVNALKGLSDANVLTVPLNTAPKEPQASPRRRVVSRVIGDRDLPEKLAKQLGFDDGEQLVQTAEALANASELVKLAAVATWLVAGGVVSDREYGEKIASSMMDYVKAPFAAAAAAPGAIKGMAENYIDQRFVQPKVDQVKQYMQQQVEHPGAMVDNYLKDKGGVGGVLGSMMGGGGQGGQAGGVSPGFIDQVINLARAHPARFGGLLAALPMLFGDHPMLGALVGGASLFGPEAYNYMANSDQTAGLRQGLGGLFNGLTGGSGQQQQPPQPGGVPPGHGMGDMHAAGTQQTQTGPNNPLNNTPPPVTPGASAMNTGPAQVTPPGAAHGTPGTPPPAPGATAPGATAPGNPHPGLAGGQTPPGQMAHQAGTGAMGTTTPTPSPLPGRPS
jgi:hypothetical protein